MYQMDGIPIQSIHTFKDWEPSTFADDKVCFEVIYLPPKCDFDMGPASPHYIVSMEHTVVQGRHFYWSAIIMTTCVGMVHTFMLGHNVTNTCHNDTKCWLTICPSSGSGTIVWMTFTAQYATGVGDKWVHPTHLYKISVLAFASALIQYRADINNVKDVVTEDQLKKAVHEHIQKDHPDLFPALEKMVADKDGWLVWSSPPITMQRCDTVELDMAAEGKGEHREHSQHCIY
ncbi:hypothetical protein FIBSPDRAFT_892617 [Athelia psychrophila]|uniref:Uncharacterized protein n=1 Tax=Athelia psychrophila TaxID=1759441 RepID=A0A166ICH3_9AGAM|nr:hypothetical protein FIBSPDRAFT_892617 [Fibularhizoctonia sp. CBS 109695]